MTKKTKSRRVEKIRLAVILVISLLVIVTGAFFSINAFARKDIGGAILGIIIALVIIAFAFIVYKRGSRDLKQGFPIQDERSRKVLEKASSMAFYISLYLLLLVGFLSERVIKFRDVSQATSISVGLMAILFAIFWIYYSRKEF